MATTPWWNYPYIDRFGQIDSEGPYYQPDINVQVPGGYPIAAILPGTVTSVQQTSWGQNVVTVRLDNPLNALATHTAYQHMSAASVQQGQHVSAGDLIGYNNPSGSVPLGFSLYSGDVYGSGSAWNILQNDLAPGGPGFLDPTKYITQLNQKAHANTGTTLAVSSSSCGWWCYLFAGGPFVPPGCEGCDFFPGNPGTTPGQQQQQAGQGILTAITPWITNPARILKMIAGLMLVGLAIFLVASPQAAQVAKKVPFV